MPNSKKFIIDFDSTFTQVEALDVLGEISLKNDPKRAQKIQAIKNITDLGMEGSLNFRESLERRLDILEASKPQISELISELKTKVSKSFQRNKEFFEENVYPHFNK